MIMKASEIADEISDMSHSERLNDERVTCLNGDGSTRMAYRFNSGPAEGKVLKIAMLGSARGENEQEMQTWMKVKGTEHEQLFCPVRNTDRKSHKWLIMDYADQTGGLIGALKSKVHSVKLKSAVEDSYDITPDNLGVHEQYGTVIFDYPWAYDLEKYA